jgi:polyisoprenoid-binding protein YceI
MDKKWFAVFIITLFLVSGKNVRAEDMSFNFADPKGVNSISIILDSVLEPIMGIASGISGNVIFDPATKKAMKGRIVVQADKIQMANQMMTKVLHSEEWLDVKKFTTIEFDFKEIVSTGSRKDMLYEYIIAGRFTCKGITKEIQVPLNVSYLPGKLKARNEKGDGDLLVLRSKFNIQRTAFDIQPEMNPASVADEIQLNISIVGYATND